MIIWMRKNYLAVLTICMVNKFSFFLIGAEYVVNKFKDPSPPKNNNQ